MVLRRTKILIVMLTSTVFISSCGLGSIPERECYEAANALRDAIERLDNIVINSKPNEPLTKREAAGDAVKAAFAWKEKACKK